MLLKAMQFTALLRHVAWRSLCFHFCCHLLQRHISMDLYEETM